MDRTEHYLTLIINDPQDRGEHLELSLDEQDVVEAVTKLGIVSSSLGRRRHLFFELQAPLTRIQIRELHNLKHRSGCIVDFYETGFPTTDGE
jgi:hypothetical protein